MGMFWVSGTNPLVSLPNLSRIRRLLSKPNLFLVVQDPFLTETAAIADVVLPTAIWGEKVIASSTETQRDYANYLDWHLYQC